MILNRFKVYRTFTPASGAGNPANSAGGSFFNIVVTAASSVTDIRGVSTSTGAVGPQWGAIIIVNSGPTDIYFHLSSSAMYHINPSHGAATLLHAGRAILLDEAEASTQGTASYVAMMTSAGQSLVTLLRGATGKTILFEDETLSPHPLLPAANQPAVPFTFNTLTAGGTLSSNGTFATNVTDVGGVIYTESLVPGVPT